MSIKEYLKTKKIRLEDFARDLGYSVSYMQKLNTGNHKAGKGVARLIEIFTSGMITSDELLNPQKHKVQKDK